MELVTVRIYDPKKLVLVSTVHNGDFGYVEPHELLTVDQIIKLRDDHLDMVDAFERHG